MRFKEIRWPDWEVWCFLILIAVIIVLSFSGCSKKVYVPVETVRTETSFRDRYLRDSIYVHDSVSFKEKGDTVLIEKWHTRWRDRTLTDTCYIQKRDSVSVPYPEERKLTKWQSLKMELGGWAFGVVLVIVLSVVVWLVYRWVKR